MPPLAYPRVCGGTKMAPITMAMIVGLSPLVRGDELDPAGLVALGGLQLHAYKIGDTTWLRDTVQHRDNLPT